MQPWQWFVGTLEFIAAWTAVEVFNFWRKYRAMLSDEREGQPPLTEHLKWIAEQDAMVTGEDGRDYRTSPNLHIPDDWRETMKRKEKAYRESIDTTAIYHEVMAAKKARKGLDYSWWLDT